MKHTLKLNSLTEPSSLTVTLGFVATVAMSGTLYSSKTDEIAIAWPLALGPMIATTLSWDASLFVAFTASAASPLVS